MKTSLWLNVDPLALYNPIFEDEFYFDGQHNGGIYNSGNLAPYIYCYQNPIRFVDPNGKQVEWSKLNNSWPKNISKTDDKNNIEVFKSVWGSDYDENTYILKGTREPIVNACATRGSIALSGAGVNIPKKFIDYYGSEGSMKGKPVTTSAKKMLKVLNELYKNNKDKIVKIENPTSEKDIKETFEGKKGIYLMIAKDGSGYTGHVGLYDGKNVLGGDGHLYASDAKEVYLFQADINTKKEIPKTN